MRRPRLVIALRIRRSASPAFSGRAYLAAAMSRSRCVLAEGCPVLAVHGALGLAPHMGQRTDNICFKVSFPGFTATLFNMVGRKDGQSCSRDFRTVPKWEGAKPTGLFYSFPCFVCSRETT